MKKALKLLSVKNFKAFFFRRASWTIVELLLAGFDEIQRLRYEIVFSSRI
jgi:hypothetical protein